MPPTSSPEEASSSSSIANLLNLPVKMERLKGILAGNGNKAGRDVNPDEYEPLRNSGDDVGDGEETVDDGEICDTNATPFSWFEYTIFVLIGVAMLWAWNMFLAASPYFASRFLNDPWSSQNFQSAILSVSTVTNLGSMVVLTGLQRSADYPNRIKLALVINTLAFALLTISTKYFRDASSKLYLSFLLVDVFFAALATGLFQNGAFAFATSFGRPEYMQAIMAGQGVAGVLPALAQIISVLVVPPPPPPTQGDNSDEKPGPPDADPIGSAAFIYFLTAVLVSIFTLLAFLPLVRRHDQLVEARMANSRPDLLAADTPSHPHPHPHSHSHHDIQEAEQAARRVVGLPALFRKLHWLAGAIFMCFVATMFFPVFTSKILSTHDGTSQPSRGRLFNPEVFIPLAFFFWNLGDLCGRVATMGKLAAAARRRPVILFTVGVARLGFLPLYMLCNIRGRGAVISSDVFYLLLVQFPYGLTNGWLASNSMVGAAEWVEEREREAAGGFMGLCLVAGLAAGSLLSFTAAGI
ncbi:Nucleoside transporter FUN26 [Cytospora mali]|uniref:Nucleoside transporter FUN26 n=1 Tax=Cytospora mali TaxID=578113 RepID=A0A194VK54_CYTMA|nr:Nucleoside transporter FUN26 [Valsa mali]